MNGPGPLRKTIDPWARAALRGFARTARSVVARTWLFVYAVVVPAGVAVLLTNLAFGTSALAFETLVVVMLMTVTFACVWWSVTRRGVQWLLWFGRFAPTLSASSLALFAAVSFTSLTALLQERGIVGVTPEPAPDELLGTTFGFYLWQLANTLPLVDIPGNLGWDKPFEFDDPLGGLLTILFAGFVILPLIQLARLILARGGITTQSSGGSSGSTRVSVGLTATCSWSMRSPRLRASASSWRSGWRPSKPASRSGGAISLLRS